MYSEVITHRGLEPQRKANYSESSLEAFEDHIKRGYAVEFDPNFTLDGIIVHHDAASELSLQRRIEDIVALQPDALCTDYPEMVKQSALNLVVT